MGLADQLNTSKSAISGYPCSIGKLIEDLQHDPDELEALNHMLYGRNGRGWSASRVYDALKAEGYTVGLQSINRHRGGRCRCSK